MLAISGAQFAALAEQGHAAFEDRCLAFIAETFPDFPVIYGENGVRKRIRVDVERAQLAGLTTERAFLQYIYLSIVLGNQFDLNRRYGWLLDLLHKDEGDPDTRIAQCVAAYDHRVENNLPLEAGEAQWRT